MQQRYYDPIAGRFLSVDPVVTNANTGKSFGRYTYANNDPFRYIDVSGMTAKDINDALENIRNTQKDLNVPKSVDARNLGSDIYGNRTAGFANPVTLSISVSDMYLEELSPAEIDGLTEVLIHEVIHRTRPRIDMILRPVKHDDIYKEAKERLKRLKVELARRNQEEEERKRKDEEERKMQEEQRKLGEPTSQTVGRQE